VLSDGISAVSTLCQQNRSREIDGRRSSNARRRKSGGLTKRPLGTPFYFQSCARAASVSAPRLVTLELNAVRLQFSNLIGQ
jgi:hypothetical protein